MASAKHLAACADSLQPNTAVAVPASTSSSFHAGLAALHASTAYSHSTAAAAAEQQLLPAVLPDPSATALLHTSVDEHIEGEDGDDASAAARSSTSNDASASTGGGSSASSALQPYPPLQPWMPDAWSPSFLWSSWLASFGHRLYASLHPYAPRLANRLRSLAHWAWSKRALWLSLLALYLALRALVALLRFFRLADLPAVRILVHEARNFIRIAFISGTGRSLFA